MSFLSSSKRCLPFGRRINHIEINCYSAGTTATTSYQSWWISSNELISEGSASATVNFDNLQVFHRQGHRAGHERISSAAVWDAMCPSRGTGRRYNGLQISILRWLIIGDQLQNRAGTNLRCSKFHQLLDNQVTVQTCESEYSEIVGWTATQSVDCPQTVHNRHQSSKCTTDERWTASVNNLNKKEKLEEFNHCSACQQKARKS